MRQAFDVDYSKNDLMRRDILEKYCIRMLHESLALFLKEQSFPPSYALNSIL